jgi:hypothetical protein
MATLNRITAGGTVALNVDREEWKAINGLADKTKQCNGNTCPLV